MAHCSGNLGGISVHYIHSTPQISANPLGRRRRAIVDMHFETLSDLLNEYRCCAEIHASTNYAVKSQVHKANRVATKMGRIASQISSLGVDAITEFATLLDESQNNVNVWVAFHLFDIHAPLEIHKRALAFLEQRSTIDDINGVGIRMRLPSLKAQCE